MMTECPQVLRNVPVRVRERLPDAAPLWAAVASMEKRLGETGRVLVRASGTEQVVRVMVEAPTTAEAAAHRRRAGRAGPAGAGQRNRRAGLAWPVPGGRCHGGRRQPRPTTETAGR